MNAFGTKITPARRRKNRPGRLLTAAGLAALALAFCPPLALAAEDQPLTAITGGAGGNAGSVTPNTGLHSYVDISGVGTPNAYVVFDVGDGPNQIASGSTYTTTGLAITGSTGSAGNNSGNASLSVRSGTVNLNVTNNFSISGGNGVANSGGAASLNLGGGSLSSGGSISVQGGDGNTANGGSVTLGELTALTAGGGVTIRGGPSRGVNKVAGGSVSLTGTGAATLTAGGNIEISGGNAGHGNGGSVNLTGLGTIKSAAAATTSLTIKAGNSDGSETSGGAVNLSNLASLDFSGKTVNINISSGDASNNGGSGGAVNLSRLDNIVTNGSFSLAGGKGADYPGGGAGAITLNSSPISTVEVGGAFSLTGGDGSRNSGASINMRIGQATLKGGVSLTGGVHAGANAGSVALTAASLNLGGDLTIKNNTSTGNSGTARLTATNLHLLGDSAWTLTKGGTNAALNVNVTNLYVGDYSTAAPGAAIFDLSASTDIRADQVQFSTVNLANGSTFNAGTLAWGLANDSTANTYHLKNLVVDQKGTFTSGGTYKPASADGSITINNVNETLLNAADGLLILGDNTTLDLNGAGDETLKVNLDPAADLKQMYDGINSGGSLILIDASTSNNAAIANTPAGYTATASGSQGLTTYDFVFGLDGGNIVIQDADSFTGQGANYAPYSDSSAASLWTTVEGQRALEKNAQDFYRRLFTGETGLGLAVTGGSFRNDTGSHVDLDTINLNLGLGHKFANSAGGLTLGAFIEAGNGSYDTYNFLANIGHTYGDGKTKYFGGGLMARQQFDGGTYLEASLRGGGVSNEYDIQGRFGAKYDESNTYYGAHLGLGHTFQINDYSAFDLYGKFFWNRVDSLAFITLGQEYVELDAVDSLRTRLGGRYTRSFANGAQIYGGLAWEQEYDGKAAGRVNNEIIRETAELKGASAFMEAGVSLRPDNSSFSIDLGLFGVAGQEEGIGGSIGFKLAF
ncbi:hypothetical protein LJB86_01005 [Deltaproteobacteria bacterium OttesenSCG-928-M10]|nr:hypothetical protein [Deltaproteobacteria bacterium OttesenSCG-928-M10]